MSVTKGTIKNAEKLLTNQIDCAILQRYDGAQLYGRLGEKYYELQLCS